MSEFRDAIARKIENEVGTDWAYILNGDECHFVTNIPDAADAVLAMPEMVAIKRALRADDEWCCEDCFKDWAEKYDLPKPVVAWVLDGNQ